MSVGDADAKKSGEDAQHNNNSNSNSNTNNDEEEEEEEEEEGTGVALVNTRANDHYVAGLKCARDHNHVGAVVNYSKAVFLLPDEPVLYAARAESFVQQCDLSSAVANYKKAIALQQQPEQAHLHRIAALLDCVSVLSFAAARFDRALTHAELALQYAPQNKTVRLHRALALFMLHRTEEAAGDTAACEGTEHCQPHVWIANAVFLLSARQFARAKGEVEKCLLVAPDLPAVSALEMYYDAVFGRFKDSAVDDMEAERWADAEQKISVCIATFPHDPDLYVARSKCHIANGQHTASVQDLFESMNKRVVPTDESSAMLADSLVRMAAVLYNSASYHQSLMYATEALKWDQSSVHARLVKGECHRAMGRHAEGLEEFAQVLEIDPNNREGQERLASAHCSHGVDLYKQGRYHQACESFTRALHHCSSNPEYHMNRAKCYLMLKRPDDAVQEMIACKKLGPTKPSTAATLRSMCPSDVLQAVEVHMRRQAELDSGHDNDDDLDRDEEGASGGGGGGCGEATTTAAAAAAAAERQQRRRQRQLRQRELQQRPRQLGNSGIYIVPSPPPNAAALALLHEKKAKREAAAAASGVGGGLLLPSPRAAAEAANASASFFGMSITASWPGKAVSSTAESATPAPSATPPQPSPTPSAAPSRLSTQRAGRRLLAVDRDGGTGGAAPPVEALAGFRGGVNAEMHALRVEKGTILKDPYGVTAVRGLVAQQTGRKASMHKAAQASVLWHGAAKGPRVTK